MSSLLITQAHLLDPVAGGLSDASWLEVADGRIAATGHRTRTGIWRGHPGHRRSRGHSDAWPDRRARARAADDL